MKDSVTRFNFDDAFKALDEIEIPVAEKGIKANRVDLKESMKKVDKFELLFEDFYDVNNADDMNAVSEEREAEVAKAKLARIEKIVDLDAETEDDILPSYVGKTIIQCPQCMTLFYKNAEDIVRDEENPDVVNVNEVCQHCGNEGGYDVVGKVAEETEAAPGDELGTDDFSAAVGDGENDIAIDDGTEATEEAPTEEGGEVDELSAEADLDTVDLDAELGLEEEPVEEEEEANESLNTSELLKKIEDKSELKTENESEKLTLNEDIEDNLDDKLKAHEDYIKYLRDTIAEEEKKLANAKNEQVKQAIQKSIDAHREELEAALPDAVKAEAQADELPDATEAGMEDATDNTSDEIEAINDETEETTESLHEAVESMTDTLNRAWEVAKKTNSPIGVTVVTPVGAGTFAKIKEWSKTVTASLYYVDAKYPDLMVTGFDEDIISRPNTIIVIDEFDRATADTQKAISNEIDNLDTQVEMVIAISHNSNINGDNFKRFKQYVATVEKETTTESLTEDVSMTSSPENFKKLLGTKEFKEPISQEEVESFFEAVKIVDNEKFWVDYRPAFEAVAKEVDGKFDFAVNFNVYNHMIVVETKSAVQKEDLSKLLNAMTNSKVCKENHWTAVYTGLEDNKDNMIKIQFEAAAQQHKDLQYEALADEAEGAEITVEGDTDPVYLETSNTETLQEGPLSWIKSKFKGKVPTEVADALTIIKANKFKYLYIVPYVNSKVVTRYLMKHPESFDDSANYMATNRRFIASSNGASNFPLLVTEVNPEDSDQNLITLLTEKLNKIYDRLKSINNSKADAIADAIGGSDKNPIGATYDLADSDNLAIESVYLIGSRTSLPSIERDLSAAESKILIGKDTKSANWILVSKGGSVSHNKDLVTASASPSVGHEDAMEDPSYKKAIEKRISYFTKIALIRNTSANNYDIIEIKDANISEYLGLRELAKSKLDEAIYYIIGLIGDKLESFARATKQEIALDIIKNVAIEQIRDQVGKKVGSFTGKLPEETKEEPTETTDDKTDGESGETTETTDDKTETSDDKTKTETPPVNVEEPQSDDDFDFYAKAFAGLKKKLAIVAIGTDNTVLCQQDPVESNLANIKTIRDTLKTLPSMLGCDNGIIVVDDSFTKSDKPVAFDCDKFCIERLSKDSKSTTNYSGVAKALGIDTETIGKHFGTMESLDVSNIDESSFNNKLTESLTTVYSNVQDFTMTDCLLDGTKLIIEGLITFKSGKTRSTQYIFEGKQATKSNLVTLQGYNKDLVESGKIEISARNLSENLKANTFKLLK